MKVRASFYSKQSRKYYTGSVTAECIDDGIGKLARWFAKKKKIATSSLINTGYEVVR